jgi:hypothetical protein
MRMVPVIVVLTAVLAAYPVAAQSPIEVGGGLGLARLAEGGDFWGDGVSHVGGNVHATLPFSPRFALDVSMTFGRRTFPKVPYGYGVVVEGGEKTRTEGAYSGLGVTTRRPRGCPNRPPLLVHPPRWHPDIFHRGSPDRTNIWLREAVSLTHGDDWLS